MKYDSLKVFHKLLQEDSLLVMETYYMAKQYYLMGYYYERIAKNPDSAFINYNSSKRYYQKYGDSSWVGRNFLNMGTIQKDFNDFFGSKETLTEAIQFLIPDKDTTYIAQSYNLLATNHRKLLNFADAVEYYNKAIAISSADEDVLIYKNNLAVTYIDDKQYDKAISLLEKVLKDSLLIDNKDEYARVLDNLAYAKFLSGKEDKVDSFVRALEMRIQNNDDRGLIASYTHLGEFYSKDDPKKAKSYFNEVIALSKTIKKPLAEKDALKFLMQLEPANVNLRDRYIFLQDSLYEQELNVKTQFAKYKYDDKEKQEENLRLEKENAEKALEINRQRTQKMILFFGLALLLSGLGFIIYYFKERTRRLVHENRTAKMEATLETEAEMSRRLHDDFGAGLNQAMLMVQGDTDKTKVLDRLDGLYNQSRNFSREINEVDTGSQFKEEFLGMLRHRTPESAKLLISGSKDVDWEGMAPLSKKVLFKVLQELMINMGRYSKATLVTIGFEEKSNMLKVAYTDNGVGASKEDLKTKNGLRNTEKRIQAIGGTITFDTGKDDGFKASITMPN
ncbi:tetratricopeptide repeat protein [Flagellimonas oceanensis]|uniref:ATP-binding protein n=1 Tax=Flagellimonas oceanensis TaxID=2499163 RepID=UPI003BAB11FE